MKKYLNILSKYKRRYGKTLSALSEELRISSPTLIKWVKEGFDIFEKSKDLHTLRGDKRLAVCWGNIKNRCGNPKDKKFKHYGGKGITVKMEKRDILILWKRDKANTMKQPSIDRIDPSGNYEFSNCRFIEMEKNRKCRKY